MSRKTMERHIPAEVRRKMSGLQIKQYGAVVKQTDGERLLTIISSTEHVDRDGDILRQQWNLANYRRAPRIQLWHGPLTIGKSLAERVVTHRGAKALEQDVQFLPEGVDAVADAQWKLYQGKFLNQWSVGFQPEKTTRIEDEEERETLGLGRFGVVFERSELLETSAVPIPANPETDTLAVAEKMLQDGTLRGHDLDALEAHNALAPVLRKAWVNRAPARVEVSGLHFEQFPGATGQMAIAMPDAAHDLSLEQRVQALEKMILRQKEEAGLDTGRIEALEKELQDLQDTVAATFSGRDAGDEDREALIRSLGETVRSAVCG